MTPKPKPKPKPQQVLTHSQLRRVPLAQTAIAKDVAAGIGELGRGIEALHAVAHHQMTQAAHHVQRNADKVLVVPTRQHRAAAADGHGRRAHRGRMRRQRVGQRVQRVVMRGWQQRARDLLGHQ